MNLKKIWQRNRNEAPAAAGASSVSDPDEDEVLLPESSDAAEEEETQSAIPAANTTGEGDQPTGGNALDPVNQQPAAGQDHPVLVAALAAGITTVANFESFMGKAKDGEKFRSNADGMFQKAAIRLYGQAQGMERVAAYAQLSADEKMSIAGAYNADADVKYGIGKDETTGGAARQTAPAEQPESVNAERGGDAGANKSAWDKLTSAQQAHGTSMGYKTPEARETYAVQALKALGKAGE